MVITVMAVSIQIKQYVPFQRIVFRACACITKVVKEIADNRTDEIKSNSRISWM